MPPMDERARQELGRLIHRLGTSRLFAERPRRLDVRGLVDKTHAVKALADAASWIELETAGRGLGAHALAEVAECLSDLVSAAELSRVLEEKQRLLGETSQDVRAKVVDIVVRTAKRRHDAHVAQALDALVSRIVATFHLSLVSSSGRLGEPAAVRAEIAGVRERVLSGWNETFGLLVSGDREACRRRLATDWLDLPREALDLARLGALLYRSVDAPYSAPDNSRPRAWAAEAAADAHAAIRWIISTLAVSSTLGRRLAVEPEATEREARGLRFDREEAPGSEVSLKDLLADPAEHAGRVVRVEGLVQSASFRAEGGKRNTLLSMVRLGHEDEGMLSVRGHFVNLVTRGLAEGSFVRATGKFDAEASWADGRPGLDLTRATFAESPSWIDRQLGAVSAIYALHPEGVLIDWSLVPRTAPESLGASADFLYAQELRVLADAGADDTGED